MVGGDQTRLAGWLKGGQMSGGVGGEWLELAVGGGGGGREAFPL